MIKRYIRYLIAWASQAYWGLKKQYKYKGSKATYEKNPIKYIQACEEMRSWQLAARKKANERKIQNKLQYLATYSEKQYVDHKKWIELVNLVNQRTKG